MKRATIICLGLLLISGPMQKAKQVHSPLAYVQLYWFKKVKKEILQTDQTPLWVAVNNSLHFVTNGGLKKLLPVLDN
ncbi:hypothetical protein KXQ82_09970 [Mucilaginibacter sp. HMF5004]|uniref:hypothetical protein n=1 Tax=Mucilaginibacter rivuli TaxID=2857527 RepID=UPI001C6037C1|nr:hypothetical protein [Mucilaginibacter rivuli]MBW4890044.1 hypothetical protein [Mucilaginibacter rivuli]